MAMVDGVEDIPKETHEAVVNFAREASTDSSGARAERYGQDMPAARGLMSDGGNFNRTTGFGGDDPMQTAIKNKFSAQYSAGERHLENNLKKAGQSDYLKKLEVASKLAGEEDQLNRQKMVLRAKYKAAQKAARGQTVGSVLGIVGGVVGAVYGGPAGAAAGYQAGNGLGQMAAG